MWCEWNMGEIGELRIWNSSGFLQQEFFIFQNKKRGDLEKKKNTRKVKTWGEWNTGEM